MRTRDVQHIHASLGAFVALTSRGKVATWGHPAYGGDSSAVQDQLYDILEVHASSGAFAAVRADGAVITWGFGEVVEADVKMDTHTKRSKGFGFVAFANEALAEACLADPKGHVLDGKRIDVKRYGSTESGAGQQQRDRRAEGVPQRGTQPSQAQRAPPDGSNPRGRGAKGDSGRIRASGDDRVHISGAPSQVEASRSAVLADIKWFSGLAESVPAEYLNEEYCISCSLPSARCGALIGRRGENINEVERKTGASVQLAKKNQADYRELTVTGTLISVYAAHLLLMRDYNEATRASEAPSAAEQKVQALEREIASLKQQIPGRAMANRSHR
ncbi:Heterogeneous nuclear ribonucleoprotein A/B [Symbiodinium microadriaticum]|uniref:Heterogeneous nuclear ribonucleoprotein A/B n=1 Tax=Symbiodinium microadriaticum TaxID=2951 RepID=A0A1Q9DVA6_SYMMI|nr:Heterogeneous nuclear ribonucleoprotein A/B [Symbiodinium microadriaticum]